MYNVMKFFRCPIENLTALTGAVSSEAAVSVRGKNLDNIDDIISTATGGNPYAGMYAAASSLSNRYGRAVMWCDFKFQPDNTTLHVYPYAAFAESTGSSLTLSGTKKLELTTERNNNDRNDVFEQDIKGGIFFKDDENEYFAAALLNNAQIMLTSGTPYCSANIFLQAD